MTKITELKRQASLVIPSMWEFEANLIRLTGKKGKEGIELAASSNNLPHDWLHRALRANKERNELIHVDEELALENLDSESGLLLPDEQRWIDDVNFCCSAIKPEQTITVVFDRECPSWWWTRGSELQTRRYIVNHSETFEKLCNDKVKVQMPDWSMFEKPDSDDLEINFVERWCEPTSEEIFFAWMLAFCTCFISLLFTKKMWDGEWRGSYDLVKCKVRVRRQ